MSPISSSLRTLPRVPTYDAIVMAAAALEELQAWHIKGQPHGHLCPELLEIGADEMGHPRVTLLPFDSMPCSLEASEWPSLYRAPEQRRGEQISPRADLYVLGLMVYEWVSGGPPWHADDPMELLRASMEDALPCVPVAAAALDGWLRKMTATAPEDRYRDAAHARQALMRIRTGAPGRAVELKNPASSGYRAWIPAMIAAVATVLLVTTAWRAMSWAGEAADAEGIRASAVAPEAVASLQETAPDVRLRSTFLQPTPRRHAALLNIGPDIPPPPPSASPLMKRRHRTKPALRTASAASTEGGPLSSRATVRPQAVPETSATAGGVFLMPSKGGGASGVRFLSTRQQPTVTEAWSDLRARLSSLEWLQSAQ